MVVSLTEGQKEALDKVLFDGGILQIKTLNGNSHDIEVVDFDIMDGEDYIFEVDKDTRSSYSLHGEVNSNDDLAI